MDKKKCKLCGKIRSKSEFLSCYCPRCEKIAGDVMLDLAAEFAGE